MQRIQTNTCFFGTNICKPQQIKNFLIKYNIMLDKQRKMVYNIKIKGVN